MSKKSNKKAQNKKKSPPKVRGFWLTLALILMAVHGIFAAYLYLTVRAADDLSRPWLITLTVIHFLANIIAAVGIWYWKKWALYVYAGSAIIALVVGLLAVGMWSVFYMVLPVAIVGWLLRTKWEYFT